MSKIEITDEMIARAAAIAPTTTLADGTAHPLKISFDRAWYRKFLEAALNPPAEPEIPVSKGMWNVGGKALFDSCRYRPEIGGYVFDEKDDYMVHRIYRAMEAKRREEARVHCKKTFPYGYCVHVRGGEPRPGEVLHKHRRKDDPK